MSRTPLTLLIAATLTAVACTASAERPFARLDCGPNGEAFPLCGATRAIGRDSVGVKWQRNYVAAEHAVETAQRAALEHAVITDRAMIPSHRRDELEIVAGRVLGGGHG